MLQVSRKGRGDHLLDSTTQPELLQPRDLGKICFLRMSTFWEESTLEVMKAHPEEDYKKKSMGEKRKLIFST